MKTEDRFWKALPIRWYSFGRAEKNKQEIRLISLSLLKLEVWHFICRDFFYYYKNHNALQLNFVFQSWTVKYEPLFLKYKISEIGKVCSKLCTFKRQYRNIIIIFFFNIFENVIYICEVKLNFLLPSFSVTWFFRNHSNTLIWSNRKFKRTPMN